MSVCRLIPVRKSGDTYWWRFRQSQHFFLFSDNMFKHCLKLPVVRFIFRQALHNVVNKQADKHISYLLADSSDDSNLTRIMELSTGGKCMLEEQTLTEIPNIKGCQIIRLASKSSFILFLLNSSPQSLVVRRCSIKPTGDLLWLAPFS